MWDEKHAMGQFRGAHEERGWNNADLTLRSWVVHETERAAILIADTETGDKPYCIMAVARRPPEDTAMYDAARPWVDPDCPDYWWLGKGMTKAEALHTAETISRALAIDPRLGDCEAPEMIIGLYYLAAIAAPEEV